MWKHSGSSGGSGSGGSVLLLVLTLGISCLTYTPVKGDGSVPKDITLVRPKHLKYPSYRSMQQNASTAEENEIRRHKAKLARSHSEPLHSEESRQSSEENRILSSSYPYPNASSGETSSPSTLKRSLIPGHPGPPLHGPEHVFPPPEHKGARFGPLGITKSPPDLQFGLAFTVPFVSLSTDKLINTFAGKSYGGGGQDMSSILKLNLGGLLAALVVGIGAFLFVPGLLNAGKLGGGGLGGGGAGWGSSILDSILPQGLSGILEQFLGIHNPGYGYDTAGGGGWGEDHVNSRPFGYQDYYEYNGVHNHNRKDTSGTLREHTSRREGRSNSKNGTSSSSPHVHPPRSEMFGNLIASFGKVARQYVSTAQSCLQLQICKKAVAATKEKKERKLDDEDDENFDILDFVESVSDNELVRESPLSQEIKKAHEYGQKHGQCQKYEKPECK